MSPSRACFALTTNGYLALSPFAEPLPYAAIWSDQCTAAVCTVANSLALSR